MTRPGLSVFALAAITVLSPDSASAQEPAPEVPSNLPTASASFAADEYLSADAPIRITLSRPLQPAEGRIAIVIGQTDVTELFDRGGTTFIYRPRPLPLERGENDVVVYRVQDDVWSELGRFPLKVLRRGGFATAEAKPTLSLTNTGQLAEGHSALSPPPQRAQYQDFAMSGGLRSTHARDRWMVRTQSSYMAVSRRQEALRFALLSDGAPKFDLADYTVELERGRVTLALGNVSTGSNPYLISGFSSRGVTARLAGGFASLALAALNGSSIVGWHNLVGLSNRQHQVGSATLGLELIPTRPGGLHLDFVYLDGSVLPQTSFTQGAVVDAERSRGGGLQFSASSPSQRLRVGAGLSRSRFHNPARDPELLGGMAVVPVTEDTRNARYVDAAVGLLNNWMGGRPFATTINLTYRHERVDPLYRSVAAYTQADRTHQRFDLTGQVGVLTLQAARSLGRDNLADIPSVLTTVARHSSLQLAAPLASLLRIRARAGVWPALTYGFATDRQFGRGLPENSDFAASHVPDQVSRVHDASANWQAGPVRLQYRFNHSFQDNRQPGRANADFIASVNTLSLSWSAASTIDVSVDAAAERQTNREQQQNNRVRRLGGSAIWRPTQLTTLTAFASTSTTEDEPLTTDADNTEARFEVARGVNLWRMPGGSTGTRGQIFLRYANTAGNTLHVLQAQPSERERRSAWTLSSGLSLSLY